MRILLRNKRTGSYFQGVADWTKELAQAFDFRSPERVARFVLAAALNREEMELVLAFGDPRYNVPLPIDERYGVRGFQHETSPGVDSPWQIPPALSRPNAPETPRPWVSVQT
jgi:hypothetical protein